MNKLTRIKIEEIVSKTKKGVTNFNPSWLVAPQHKKVN